MKARNEFTADEKGQKMWIEYLRAYFAAMAMQGIIAAHNIYETGIDNELNARTAVNAADALIEALNNSVPTT